MLLPAYEYTLYTDIRTCNVASVADILLLSLPLPLLLLPFFRLGTGTTWLITFGTIHTVRFAQLQKVRE